MLLSLVLASLASAEYPAVTWASSSVNPPIAFHTGPPIDRDWQWTCDDRSDEFPLSLKARVYDFTDGNLNSGQELLLSDVDLGVVTTDPAVVNHLYDVSAPQGGHRYAYAAYCQDSSTNPGAYSFTLWRWFWYDDVPPVVAILSGPSDSVDPTAVFEFTCDEDSYGYDFGSVAYTAECRLTCTLLDDVSGTVVQTGRCDEPALTDSVTSSNHQYTALAPGVYRLEVEGRDGADNLSVIDSWVWEVQADTDADGVIDSQDNCATVANPSQDDGDADGAGDACDPCPLDATDDSDVDGACDGVDICPGADDFLDTDADLTPDCLDPCPLDAGDDSDGDGSCDSADLCVGFDDTADADGDAVPDGCDLCEGDDSSGDGDGDGLCASDVAGAPVDCDDTRDTVYPGAAELCDGLDNACDGLVDTDELDEDGDGQATCAGDCDDANTARFAGNPELCDGLDNDCDDAVPGDELDTDGDGLSACNGDCDDTNQGAHPDADEVCGNGIDDDCDGVDEACPDPTGSTSTGSVVGQTKEASAGCTCATSEGLGISWLWAALVLVGRRRAEAEG